MAGPCSHPSLLERRLKRAIFRKRILSPIKTKLLCQHSWRISVDVRSGCLAFYFLFFFCIHIFLFSIEIFLNGRCFAILRRFISTWFYSQSLIKRGHKHHYLFREKNFLPDNLYFRKVLTAWLAEIWRKTITSDERRCLNQIATELPRRPYGVLNCSQQPQGDQSEPFWTPSGLVKITIFSDFLVEKVENCNALQNDGIDFRQSDFSGDHHGQLLPVYPDSVFDTMSCGRGGGDTGRTSSGPGSRFYSQVQHLQPPTANQRQKKNAVAPTLSKGGVTTDASSPTKFISNGPLAVEGKTLFNNYVLSSPTLDRSVLPW